MPHISAVVFLCVIVIESLMVFTGNLFTIFVFWKHRNRLKRTSVLLINLAIVDLLIGFFQLTVTGTDTVPQHVSSISISYVYGHVSIAFQIMFSFASVYCLAVISLERACALIWPLRHRAASTKGYIYSVVFVWMVGASTGTISLLAKYGILNVGYWHATLCFLVILALMVICASYLAIRRKLNCRVPAIETAHNRQNGLQQNTKLSKTLFIVIAASLICWFPSTLGYFIDHLCSKCLPLPLRYSFPVLYLANSVVNRFIYSFRIPIFREALKRMKLRKKSKQYRVN